MKKVLVFGAGRVAKPCVDYMLRDRNIHVTVVDIDQEAVARVTGNRENTGGLVRKAGNEARAVIEEVKPDILINLLPPAFDHFAVADLAKEPFRAKHDPFYE